MAGTVSTEPLSASTEAEYTAFLASAPEALLYYGLAYRDFLKDLLAAEPCYWLARENGRVTGVLPLMRKSGPFGEVLNSLPYFGSNGGALAATDAARSALMRVYEAQAGQPEVASATWVCHPLASAGSPSVRHDLTDDRISQITSLEGGCDAVMARFDSSARRNIKRALSEGVTVAVENSQLEFLERVHRQNMLDIGGNPKTPAFFQTFPRHFRPDDDYRIYVARIAGEPVAALLLFYFGRTVEYFTPVTVDEARPSQPMAAILDLAMRDAIAEGYADWNWGGTWRSQDGVRRFKKKWGAREQPYGYYITLGDRALLKQTPQVLSAAYPGFFVAPFHLLESQ